MEPTISNGALVIVDQSQRTVVDGIVAFILDDTAYLFMILDGLIGGSKA